MGEDMNLFLEYYYQIKPIQIKKEENKFQIKTDEEIYYLYEVSKEEWENVKFLWNDERYHRIILNQFQQMISLHEGKYYALCIPTKEKEINILYPQPIGRRGKVFWREQWIKQSDEMREYYQTIQEKYPWIEESIDYYFGLWEMGIYLLKRKEEMKEYVISHKCFSEEFWNPFQITFDIKEKDLGEYLKYLFWNHLEEKVEFFLKECENYDYELVTARLCYPNFYFKALQNYVEKDEKEEFITIVQRTREYEKYIQKIQTLTKQKTSLWDEMF